MKNDKFRLGLMGFLTAIMLITILLYGYMIVVGNKVNPGGIIAFSIPLILGAFMIFFIARRYKDVKEGMPLEDERSKKVMSQAAAQSFFISLYWLLAISWFESFFARTLFGGEQLTASNAVGGGIAGMAVIFAICWFYYDKKVN